MNVVRRAYLYLAAAFSLQAATWAVIGLLRGLLDSSQSEFPEAAAFHISVLVVAIPLFLAHWLIAQRDADGDVDERAAVLRRVYLYGMLALFVIPMLANLFSLVATTLAMALNVQEPRLLPGSYLGPEQLATRSVVAVLVLTVLAYYHLRQIGSDETTVSYSGGNGTVRRVFVYGFSALGLILTVVGTVQVLRWVLVQTDTFGLLQGAGAFGSAPKAALAREAARALVGLVTWVLAWRWANRLFTANDVDEQRSVLRKVYLYGAVFAGVVSTVGALGLLLAGVFRKGLGLAAGGDLSGPLPVAIVMGIVWAYHARAVKADADASAEAPRQAAVRRLYRYLVAGVGLATALLGVAGVVQVLVQLLADGAATDPLREQLALSAAGIAAGAPVWLWQWSRVQRLAVEPGPSGGAERRSMLRKLYLFFFLFVATIVVLTGAVFIVFRLIAMVLGAGDTDPEMTTRAAEAAGYCVVGVLVWLYHGRALRQDAAMGAADVVDMIGDTHTVVLGSGASRRSGDQQLSRRIHDALRRELPGLPVKLVDVGDRPAAATHGPLDTGDEQQVESQETGDNEATVSIDIADVSVDDADVIVSPWGLITADGLPTADGKALRDAIAASRAIKVLLPTHGEGWEWAGVDPYDQDELVEQAVHAVRQVAYGDAVTPKRPLGAGAIIGIVVLAVVMFVVVVAPIVGFMLQGGIGYLLGG